MMPAYRSMDSYPYQRNQIPYSHCYHPGIEAVPPQIRADPSKSPFSYEQFWPYAGSYGHPMPAHFCCGHNNFPGYYSYRPSYPHGPAPSPIYCSGGCPAYAEPFFVPYSPQPHYSMELPRYEYDKYMPRDHHCCGCPNHPCNQKEEKSVKIEEHEPDAGKKVNDAVVPIQLRNYPYPLIWIPPEYTSNRQLKNPTTAEVGEQQDNISHDRKPNADAQPAQEPRAWNEWLPFYMKGAPNMVHDGDGIKSQNYETDNKRRESEDGRLNQKHQREHKKSELPFPIIWLPYYNKQEEGEKTNNQDNTSTPKCIEEAPHTFKSVPVKSYVDECVTNGTRSNQTESIDTSASDVTEKVTNERSIPVKQMESHQDKNNPEGNHKREMDVPVNQKEENVTKESSHTSGKRQPTSPPKASKLPPVCLRVDPLPRKKNGNGSSRSPSPPASKEHSQTTAGEASKTPSCGMNKKAQPNLKLQNAPNTNDKFKREERIIQVSDNKTSENKGAESKDESQSKMSIPSVVSTETKESYTDSDKCKTEDKKEDKGAENTVEEAAEVKEVKDSTATTNGGQKERRVLSDRDAAVLIQAAYRGYQVRKWEPLKKMKQIAEVSKEVTDVRGRIQAFEDSSDLQNDDKQKIAIGETIMRLLLKLDTIQGLHPSFREIRKSLARELVTLQERLDSIMAKKPQQQMQELVVQKPVEVTPLNTQNGENQQEQQEEELAVPGDTFEGYSNGSQNTLEKCEDQVCNKNILPNDGGSESQTPVDPASNEGAETTTELVNEDINQVLTVDALNCTNDLSETDKMAGEPEAKSEVNDIPVEVDKLDMTAMEELPVGVIDEEIIDVPSVKDKQNEKGTKEAQSAGCMDGSLLAMVDDSARDELDSVTRAMMELPVGVLDDDDEDKATDESGKDDGTNISKGKVQSGNEGCIEELPVGLLDEDTSKFELEKHDETKTYEEVVPAEEEECNADESTMSFTDDNEKVTQLEQPVLEEKEEVQSSGESDGWVKIEFQKDDELKGDALPNVAEEVGNETKFPSLTTEASGDELGNEDVCLEANDGTNMLAEPMEFVPINDLQKEKEPEEKPAQNDGQDMVAEQVINGDDKDTETMAKEETELSAASPALTELPVGEHDGGLNGDMKLLEENEKLRKLMKELLEAGNEQLSVISNLTGRVKDLEKKLAKNRRSKRVRTKRYDHQLPRCLACNHLNN